MPLLRMLFMIILIGIPITILQIIIWRVSRPNRLFKYIPTFVLFIVGIFCIIKAVYFSEGMEDLAYFIIAMMVTGVMLISLITGIILDIIEKHKR
ncbi:MAG: hypothetical protein GX957_11140 [Clostridiaceae bacterium]|nr:hypothetical protein [Clostridiaceae bacterium]